MGKKYLLITFKIQDGENEYHEYAWTECSEIVLNNKRALAKKLFNLLKGYKNNETNIFKLKNDEDVYPVLDRDETIVSIREYSINNTKENMIEELVFKTRAFEVDDEEE